MIHYVTQMEHKRILKGQGKTVWHPCGRKWTETYGDGHGRSWDPRQVTCEFCLEELSPKAKKKEDVPTLVECDRQEVGIVRTSAMLVAGRFENSQLILPDIAIARQIGEFLAKTYKDRDIGLEVIHVSSLTREPSE